MTVTVLGWSAGPELKAVLAMLGCSAILLLIAVSRRRRESQRDRGRLAPAGPAAQQALPSGAVSVVPPEEEGMPRWLRPSVRAGRFSSMGTGGPADARPVRAFVRTPVLFDHPVQPSVERLTVRYDHVPLLDRPDEALGHTEMEVGTGDEVEVMGVDDIWARVRTPGGTTGWVTTMALGSAVRSAPDAQPQRREPAGPTLPPAEESAQLQMLRAMIALRNVRLDSVLDASTSNEAPSPPARRMRDRPPA